MADLNSSISFLLVNHSLELINYSNWFTLSDNVTFLERIFFVTFFSIPPLITISKKKGFLDFPDIRKLHNSPTVRLGGLSIFIGLYSSNQSMKRNMNE